MELGNLLVSEGDVIFVDGCIRDVLCLNFSFLLHVLVVLCLFFHAVTAVSEPSLICLDVGDHINVSSVYVLEGASGWIDSNTHSLVDTCDFNPITWFHIVDQVFVGTKMDCLRSFAFGYALRSLLHLDMLLVREDACVVLDLERVSVVAILAEGWLLDAAHLNNSILFTVTFNANEVSLLHFWHNIAVADHNSTECH